MKLSEQMKQKMLLSFELFPPKTDKGMENLPGTIEHLCEYNPSYISCTYGAGGTNVGRNMDVCKMIKDAAPLPLYRLPHGPLPFLPLCPAALRPPHLP